MLLGEGAAFRGPLVMMSPKCQIMPGLLTTLQTRLMRSGRKLLTLWGCTICTAMPGNGCATGMAIIQEEYLSIRPILVQDRAGMFLKANFVALLLEIVGWCGAGRSSIRPRSCAP